MDRPYPEERETKLAVRLRTDDGKFPWRRLRRSFKWLTKAHHRTERRRAPLDPECPAFYNRNVGYEY